MTIETLQKHVAAMSFSSPPIDGMDIIIVVTNNAQQETYWQTRLAQAIGYSVHEKTKVIVVEEDWPGGAGNALGTLYAYQKATTKGKQLYDIDLLAEQSTGAAIAMYHTAGQGTRLAPLPGSEKNNKSAVKLPSLRPGSQPLEFLTILEAVIRQTAIFAPGRKGRLSVFWGDQIFIPSKTPPKSYHIADILACVTPQPSREVWEAKGLNRYGLIAVAPKGGAKQLEKVNYDTFLRLIDDGVVAPDDRFGTSLGSFSLSFELLKTLLAEFSPELTAKKGKLDSDPHWWMPLTLDRTTYVRIMGGKGMDASVATSYYERLQAMKARLLGTSKQPILEAVDVGQDSYWWDFGTLRTYYDNCLKLTKDSLEGHAIRTFFGTKQAESASIDIDASSVIIGCDIKQGTIRNSILIDVKADNLNVADSVIVHSDVGDVTAEGCLLYNVIGKDSRKFTRGTVRADALLHSPNGHLKLTTRLDRNGNADWNTRLEGNPISYAQLYSLNEQ